MTELSDDAGYMALASKALQAVLPLLIVATHY